MMPARSTSIHIMASVCPSPAGSSSIAQREGDMPIRPANATYRGASTAVTSWLRLCVRRRSFARCSTREPGSSGPPPRTQHSSTVGAHSGQRPTSQTYAHTASTLPVIVMRLSVLIVIGRPLGRGRTVSAAATYHRVSGMTDRRRVWFRSGTGRRRLGVARAYGGSIVRVHVVVPEGFDSPSRPTGGNIYDRRICAGLAEAGWQVLVANVAGPW